MKKLLLTHLIGLGIFAYGQTADVVEGCAPLEVKFAAPASSSTYYWDFKNGITSDKQNPSNLFSSEGTYDVEYRDVIGGAIIGKVKIKVYPAPVLNVSVTEGCAPLNAKFTNSSVVNPAISVDSYIWVFGDGTSFQGKDAPSHIYNLVGKYSISLKLVTTSMNTCNKTVVFTNKVEVVEPPIANIVADKNISCDDDLNVTFTTTSSGKLPLVYNWVFGNSATSTLANPPIQKFTKGQYTPSLTVSYQNLLGCNRTAQTNISVGKPNPKIIFSKDSICPNTETRITASIPGLYVWDYSSDATPSFSSGNNDLVNYKTPGIHKVTLKVTSFDGQCSGTVSDTLVVHPQITATIDPQPLFECSRPLTVPFKAISNQTNVSYNWQFLGKDTSMKQNVTKIYTRKKDKYKYDVNKPDSIFALLTVTSNKTKCVAKDTVLDIFLLPTARIKTDRWRGCGPLAVMFDPKISIDYEKNRIKTWKWIFGDGESKTISTDDTVGHIYKRSGVYNAFLEVTTERGCKDTSYTVRIEVGEDLSGKIDFASDKSSICTGELINFSVTKTIDSVDAYHFFAEGNRTFHCPSANNLKWQYLHEAGVQDVSLMVDFNGCPTTVTKNDLITVKSAVAIIGFSSTCADPFAYSFKSESQNTESYSWDFGDGKTSNLKDMLHTYDSTGDYTVVLTVQNSSGCPATTDTKVINVRKILAKIGFTDTLLCANSSYSFDASKSVDVDANCYTGYTWRFPDLKDNVKDPKRPLTTDSPTGNFSFSDLQNLKKQTVMLVVKDINGCKDTAFARFSVYKIDVVPTASKMEICIPSSVVFTDLSTADTTIVSRDWTLGDRSKDVGLTFNHLYDTLPTISLQPDPNLYEITLKIEDKLGCKEENKDMRIRKYNPKSNIIITKDKLCLGDTAFISATDFKQQGSRLKFNWDFGNGINDTSISKKIVYPQPKSYLIKLKYEEISSGCKDSALATVDLQSKPHASFYTDVDSLPILCSPQNVAFKDNSTGDFAFTNYWDFGNGQYSAQPQYTLFYEKGSYTVFHEVSTSYGCKDDTSRKFDVFRPEGRFTVSKNLICKGEAVTFNIMDTTDISSFSWYFGDGDTLSNKSPVTHEYHFHPPTGQTLATLIIRGFNDECSVDIPTPINIHQVVSDFERETEYSDNDTVICFNTPQYHFTNKSKGSDSYFWNFGDGQTSSTENNPVHTYATPGVYDVSLMIKNNGLGCKDTLVKKAIVVENPIIKVVGDTICQGQGKLKLFVVNPNLSSSYKWTPNLGLDNDTLPNIESAVEHTTKYELSETDTNKCESKAEALANVIEPLGLLDWDTTIVVGDQIALPAHKTELEIFKWNPEQGLSCTNCSYPLIRPLKDTTYYLNVTDVMGCFSNDVVYKIKVIPETFVKMPTAFTPNNDGSNDIVNVRGWGIKDLLEFKIFNRWGQLLYSSNNIQEGWDGKFNGNLQNSDVYVYKVKVKTWTDKEISQEGYINLIH